MKYHQEERLMTVIIGPHISEKSTIQAEEFNQIVFKVRKDATKREIKLAIEKLFEVGVDKVSTINYQGKTKGRGNLAGRRTNWKKAYITLSKGSQIDFLGSE